MKTPMTLGAMDSLCLALYHAWEPDKYFMIITAYMDESGTHGSETLLISAILGNVKQWHKFEKKTQRLFDRNEVKVFHAKEWNGSKGDFKGWKVDRKIKFMDNLAAIINSNLESGCSAILNISDYKKYYDNEEKPKKLPRDSAYGVCFRAALSFAADATLNQHPHNERRMLNVVVEQGHKNAGDTLRLFEMLRANLKDEYKGLLGTITFADKRDCLPLSAPDALAYGSWRSEEGFEPTMRAKFPLRGDSTYRGNYHRLLIGEETLKWLKHDLMLQDATRLAYGAHR